MKPIGTITNYIPFMDEVSKSIIIETMAVADNYSDFAKRMTKRVCEEDHSDLTIFFATLHAAFLFDFDCLDKIAKKYGKLPIIRPILFLASAFQGRKGDILRAREASDIVLLSEPAYWLALETNLWKLEAEVMEYPREVYDEGASESINQLLQDNGNLNFLGARYYNLVAEQAKRDGTYDVALQYLQKAIDNSLMHDNQNRLAHVLRQKALIIEVSDRIQALQLLKQASTIMKSLGAVIGFGNIQFQMSKIEATRGEYDLAIQRNMDIISLRQKRGLPVGLFALTLSTLYNVISEPNAGLEWALMAEAELENNVLLYPRSFLNQAWSLVLSHQVSEALALIDSTRESILKSGVETNLAWLYFINGVYEIAEGNFAAAATSIEEALNIYERRRSSMSMNICIHHLAKIDVLQSRKEPYDDYMGNITWLAQLEEKAVSENLPGVLGQSLLLKAELFLSHGDTEEAKTAFRQLDVLVQQPGLDFLRRQLQKISRE